MKIFQVLNHFLPGQTAGTEIYTWALSKQLQQMGCKVEVIIPNYGQQESTHYEYDGLKVFKYAEPSIVDRSLIMAFRKPVGLVAFINYIKKEQPDVVHFHELAGSNGITLHHVSAAKKLGAKVLMTFHLAGYTCKTGTLVYKEKTFCDGRIDIRKCSACYLQTKTSPITKPFILAANLFLYGIGIDTTKWNAKIGTALGTGFLIEKLKNDFESLVCQCDKLVVLTNWYRKILLLNGVPEDKIAHVSQGLPFDSGEEQAAASEKTSLPLRVMFLGRLVPTKGLDLLITALDDIKENEIMLSIYGQSGDEIYEDALRKRAERKKNIYWKGKLRQEEVIATMKQSDILCLCSTFSEMSPLVIQEAYAAGIPVLASNVYGNAEQVKDGFNGWMFKFKDADDLRKQLQALINDPSLIDDAKKNIPSTKPFHIVVSAYLELYKNILNMNTHETIG